MLSKATYVASSDHYPGNRSEAFHPERNQRGWWQILIPMDRNPHGNKRRSGKCSEFMRVMPWVVCYDNTQVRKVTVLVFYVFCQSLGGLDDSQGVHAGEPCSHPPAETSSSKLDTYWKDRLVLSMPCESQYTHRQYLRKDMRKGEQVAYDAVDVSQVPPYF